MKTITAFIIILVTTATSQDQQIPLFFTMDQSSVSLTFAENSSLMQVRRKPTYQSEYQIVKMNDFDVLRSVDAVEIHI